MRLLRTWSHMLEQASHAPWNPWLQSKRPQALCGRLASSACNVGRPAQSVCIRARHRVSVGVSRAVNLKSQSYLCPDEDKCRNELQVDISYSKRALQQMLTDRIDGVPNPNGTDPKISRSLSGAELRRHRWLMRQPRSELLSMVSHTQSLLRENAVGANIMVQ